MSALESIRDTWRITRDAAEVASAAAMSLQKSAAQVEIDLYEAEGRGDSQHCAWLRAWLAGDMPRCREIIGGPEYLRELREGWEEHKRPDLVTVEHVAGIPVTVDAA